MKKIVLFAPTTTWGGVEKNVLLRAQFLSQNHLVYIVLLNGLFAYKFKDLPNIKVINVKKRGGDLNVRVVFNYIKNFKTN